MLCRPWARRFEEKGRPEAPQSGEHYFCGFAWACTLSSAVAAASTVVSLLSSNWLCRCHSSSSAADELACVVGTARVASQPMICLRPGLSMPEVSTNVLAGTTPESLTRYESTSGEA